MTFSPLENAEEVILVALITASNAPSPQTFATSKATSSESPSRNHLDEAVVALLQ